MGPYDEAQGIKEEIDSLIEEMPERAEEFATSAQERSDEIWESIEEAGTATPRQIEALENIRDGLARWLK